MSAFVTERRIRWAHCDPAGIVFLPQYFVLLNDQVEDWCADGLGVDFARLHGPRGLAIPTVRLECDFERASRLGDAVRLELAVAEVGGASLTLERRVVAGDEVRLRARQILVCVDGASLRARPWPDDLRGAFERWRLSPAGGADSGPSPRPFPDPAAAAARPGALR